MGITEILIRQAQEEVLLREAKFKEMEATMFKEMEATMLKERESALLKERKTTIKNMRKIGFSAEKIADILEYPHAEVVAIFAELDDAKQR